jgi:hypothetical protein
LLRLLVHLLVLLEAHHRLGVVIDGLSWLLVYHLSRLLHHISLVVHHHCSHHLRVLHLPTSHHILLLLLRILISLHLAKVRSHLRVHHLLRHWLLLRLRVVKLLGLNWTHHHLHLPLRVHHLLLGHLGVISLRSLIEVGSSCSSVVLRRHSVRRRRHPHRSGLTLVVLLLSA